MERSKDQNCLERGELKGNNAKCGALNEKTIFHDVYAYQDLLQTVHLFREVKELEISFIHMQFLFYLSEIGRAGTILNNFPKL